MLYIFLVSSHFPEQCIAPGCDVWCTGRESEVTNITEIQETAAVKLVAMLTILGIHPPLDAAHGHNKSIVVEVLVKLDSKTG